jgi:hypothetical protein
LSRIKRKRGAKDEEGETRPRNRQGEEVASERVMKKNKKNEDEEKKKRRRFV